MIWPWKRRDKLTSEEWSMTKTCNCPYRCPRHPDCYEANALARDQRVDYWPGIVPLDDVILDDVRSYDWAVDGL